MHNGTASDLNPKTPVATPSIRDSISRRKNRSMVLDVTRRHRSIHNGTGRAVNLKGAGTYTTVLDVTSTSRAQELAQGYWN